MDDESAANILAEAGLEITESRYNEIKKKVHPTPTTPGFVPSPTPPRLPPQPIVVAAVRAADRTNFTSDKQDEVPAPKKNVEIKTTKLRPPEEPLLEQIEPKRRKAA